MNETDSLQSSQEAILLSSSTQSGMNEKEEEERGSNSQVSEDIISISQVLESVKKNPDDSRVMRLPSLPSHIDVDTMDRSNCATSPSRSTFITSVPGTIYYNDTVNIPHVENARKVSDFSENTPKKISAINQTRPTTVRNNSESSSVPRMQWIPPQPLSGNCQETQSSEPQFAAHTYASPMHSKIVPSLPMEELSMDGLTDTVRKRGLERLCCEKKGHKAIMWMTGLIILLSLSAVFFSIIYVSNSNSTNDEKDKKDDKSGLIGRCHPECYDPSKSLVCRCSCYTPKDDKFYTCNSKIGNDEEVDDTIVPDGNTTKKGDNYTWYDGDDDDDDNNDDDDRYSDFYGPDPIYDKTITLRSCRLLCYRLYIHRFWDPNTCNPTCYDNVDQFEARWLLWMEWYKQDLDEKETPPPDSSSQSDDTNTLPPTVSPTDVTWPPTVS